MVGGPNHCIPTKKKRRREKEDEEMLGVEGCSSWCVACQKNVLFWAFSTVGGNVEMREDDCYWLRTQSQSRSRQ